MKQGQGQAGQETGQEMGQCQTESKSRPSTRKQSGTSVPDRQGGRPKTGQGRVEEKGRRERQEREAAEA